MTDDNNRFDPERNPVEILAEEFSDRCRRGESPSIAAYADKHPHLAEQINRLFPAIATIEQLGAVEKVEHRVAQSQAAFAKHRIEQVGDYRIVQEIGRGGMGIVYEAVQESLGRRVAVKLLVRQALLDEKHLQRFKREARTAARLHHTNIVPVFGVGDQDGHHYYVMQFIPGVGLDEVLAELKRIGSGSDSCESELAGDSPSHDGRASQVARVVGALREGAFRQPRKLGSSADLSVGWISHPPESTGSKDNTLDLRTDYWHSVARIGLQVADALSYAHSQGTLHRDIKPGNLLLGADGVVWVADFGLAKALEHDDVSQTGDVVGTLRYMAPEQFAGQADHRSDIYSLGLTLYEALTLKPAYEDTSRTHLLLGRGNESEVARPRKVNPDIPRDLETIVLKASARDPADRYHSAGELAADLQCFLDDRPIQARRATSLERFTRWCARNPAVASLSSVAALLLVLVAVSTSIGYVRTNAALSRESDERKRAETEKQKAETTLGISLEALERVYRRFAPDRMIEPKQLMVTGADGEQFEVSAQPVLSKETAALLEDILAFYDRFAQQDSDNLTLRAEAAKANRRVGDIQQRLGAYEQAENAYLRAIDRYKELSAESSNQGLYTAELARIHNELGNVYRAWQRPDDAHESFDAALHMLQSLAAAESSPSELRIELARTFYFLAKRSPPEPGAGPPGSGRGLPRGPPARDRRPPHQGPRADGPPPHHPGPHRGPPGPDRGFGSNFHYLDQAIKLLTDLDKNESNHPEHRYLLALCYRERARGSQSDDGVAAIEILAELSGQYPRIADYRYELSETYARMDMRRLRDSELRVAQERLRKALNYADTLAVEHPNIPDYAHSRAHTNHKLGTALRRSARDRGATAHESLLRESENHYREAVRIQSSLVERFSTATSYRLWLAKMQESLAETLRNSEKLEEARSIVEASISSLNAILDNEPDLWFVHHSLAKHNRTLAEILDQLDDKEGANQARERAEEHRRQPARRRALPSRERPGGFAPRPRGRAR